jgi:hypothetical protein
VLAVEHPIPLPLELCLQPFAQLIGNGPEHLGHRQLHRAAVVDEDEVRRDGDRTVRIGVELRNHLVGVDAAGQRELDLHLVRGVVVDARDLDASTLGRRLDRADQALGRGAVRDLTDRHPLLVDRFDPRADVDLAAPVVVGGDVDEAARRKIGRQRDGLALQ